MPLDWSVIPSDSSAAAAPGLSRVSELLIPSSSPLIPVLSDVGTVGSLRFRNPGEERPVNRQILTRRTAPVVAALALGGGAGAAIYAATAGPDSSTQTIVASVPASPTANTVASTTSTLTQLYKDAVPGVVDITVTQGSSSNAPFSPGGGSTQ